MTFEMLSIKDIIELNRKDIIVFIGNHLKTLFNFPDY